MRKTEKDLEARVKKARKLVELTEAALAGFRGDRLKGETLEETHARFWKHEKSCKHCSSYEAPDRYCATFSEHVARCENGGRIMGEVDKKKAWPCGSCGLFGGKHKENCHEAPGWRSPESNQWDNR